MRRDDFENIPLYFFLVHDPTFCSHLQQIQAARQYAYNPREKCTKAKLREQRHRAMAYEFQNRPLKPMLEI